jgi:copper homeostasis protein
VPGVVFGILQSNGSIDRVRCKSLVQVAKKYRMQCTFHRAFDMACEPFQALADIIDLKFGTTFLSS